MPSEPLDAPSSVASPFSFRNTLQLLPPIDIPQYDGVTARRLQSAQDEDQSTLDKHQLALDKRRLVYLEQEQNRLLERILQRLFFTLDA